MKKKRQRAVNFDLSTKALKKYYPSKHYRKAYKDLKGYLIAKGFVHRQWSGYRSAVPLSDIDVMKIFDGIFDEFPWLKKCANRFDVTEIGSVYDILRMEVVTFEHEPNALKNKKLSLDELVDNAKQETNNNETSQNKDPQLVKESIRE